MKRITSILQGLLLGAAVTMVSCSEEDAPIPLVANAGADISATVATPVTLDGSASTGPQGFTYEWLYTSGPVSSQSDLGLTGTSSASASFTPQKNGVYNFNLRITHNGAFSEDQVSVTVSGAITLPTSITSSFTLEDIEPDASKPDYVANDLVTISSNFSAATTSGIVIQFAESAGLVVESGSVNLTGMTLTSINGWKGILLNGGSLTMLSPTTVEKAGKNSFEGQTETASLVMTGGTLKLQGANFTGSLGTYDLLVAGGNFNDGDVVGNSFATAIPIKSDIKHVSKFYSNTMPAEYNYILLTTPGAATVHTAPYTEGFQFHANKYLIDGDFSSGSNVHFNSSAQVFMKEGTGIFMSSGTISSNGCIGCNPSTASVIDGLNSSSWKGIAIGAGAQASISGLEIKNAGSALFNTGSFVSSFKAAIYFAASNYNASLSSSKITDSKGYGVYSDSSPGLYMNINNTTFTNPVNSPISVLVDVVDRTITSAATNTYTMSAGVAAVEVRTPNPSTNSPIGTWHSLGGDNYYLFTNHVVQQSPWILSAGTSLKLKAGKSLRLAHSFTAIGTANQPIVFDSEAGTAGTWGGITVESLYKFEFCQIKNGGELNIFNGTNTLSTEKANIVFNYSGTNNANTFKNNTISGSAGYGILVEDLRQDPDAENVVNANTFSNNVSGNVIVK